MNGPRTLQVWRAAPFLPLVPADLAGDPRALARATERRRAEWHLCVLCEPPAAPAVFALHASLADGTLRWCDVCEPCAVALRSEALGGDDGTQDTPENP